MLNNKGLRLELAGEKLFGPCDCCQQLTRRVWGYVYESESAVAAYFVEWTPGHTPQNAAFDFIIGAWGDDKSNSGRQAVALAFRITENGPQFLVIDAAGRAVGKSSLVGEALSREQVVGTPLASDVFSLCDVVYLQDPRIEELRA